MKPYKKTLVNALFFVIIVYTYFLLSGCKKYLEIPLPLDKVAGSAAYVSDNSTSAVVTNLLTDMYAGNSLGGSIYTGITAISILTSLYTDELQPLDADESITSFYQNNALPGNTGQWSTAYRDIYVANIAIQGITNTTAKLNFKGQWLGECYFSRALSYLNLVMLYGDVAIPTTPNYDDNVNLKRVDTKEVYKLIITDLLKAQSLLPTDYRDGYGAVTTDRARPNKWAATALLARAYLYSGDYDNAAKQATSVINNAAYELTPPAGAFLKNGNETIFALAAVQDGIVKEFSLFNNNMPAIGSLGVNSYGVHVALSASLVANFEPNDARFKNWIRATSFPAVGTQLAVTYYYPNKYKSNISNAEFNIILRLGEQYLIRAEARTELNDIKGAQSDLNAVRARASLGGSTASSHDDLINAILKERRSELFTEQGHRFFDLKRTKKIDEVMKVVTPAKGGIWSSFKQYWPIPLDDIKSGSLTQTPGY